MLARTAQARERARSLDVLNRLEQHALADSPYARTAVEGVCARPWQWAGAQPALEKLQQEKLQQEKLQQERAELITQADAFLEQQVARFGPIQ